MREIRIAFRVGIRTQNMRKTSSVMTQCIKVSENTVDDGSIFRHTLTVEARDWLFLGTPKAFLEGGSTLRLAVRRAANSASFCG